MRSSGGQRCRPAGWLAHLPPTALACFPQSPTAVPNTLRTTPETRSGRCTVAERMVPVEAAKTSRSIQRLRMSPVTPLERKAGTKSSMNAYLTIWWRFGSAQAQGTRQQDAQCSRSDEEGHFAPAVLVLDEDAEPAKEASERGAETAV